MKTKIIIIVLIITNLISILFVINKDTSNEKEKSKPVEKEMYPLIDKGTYKEVKCSSFQLAVVEAKNTRYYIKNDHHGYRKVNLIEKNNKIGLLVEDHQACNMVKEACPEKSDYRFLLTKEEENELKKAWKNICSLYEAIDPYGYIDDISYESYEECQKDETNKYRSSCGEMDYNSDNKISYREITRFKVKKVIEESN